MKSCLWPSLIRIKSVVKVGPLSDTRIKGVGAILTLALTQLWLAWKLSYLWFESKVSKGTFDARHIHIWQNLWSLLTGVKGVSHLTQIKNGLWLASKWSKVWSNMAFDTFDIWQRRGVKAIFRAVRGALSKFTCARKTARTWYDCPFCTAPGTHVFCRKRQRYLFIWPIILQHTFVSYQCSLWTETSTVILILQNVGLLIFVTLIRPWKNWLKERNVIKRNGKCKSGIILILFSHKIVYSRSRCESYMSGSRRDINHAVNPWHKLNNQWINTRGV